MNIAILVVRILLGLIFLVFGFNGFLRFIPVPPPKNARAVQFTGALGGTGYMAFVFLLQIAGGLLLLLGFYVPFALLLLGPVVVNIILYHLFLEPKGLAFPVVLGLLSAFLLWAYRASYAEVIPFLVW